MNVAFARFVVAAICCCTLVSTTRGDDQEVNELSVEETVGAAFVPPSTEGGGYLWNLYARASPHAKEPLYQILNDSSQVEYHPAVLHMLGFIGDSEDAKRLEELLTTRYAGVLDGNERSTAIAVLDSLGLMYGQNVEKAGEILNRMLNPGYWRKVNFRWRSGDIDAPPGFVYESLAHVLTGYALSQREDLNEKTANVLAHIDDAEIKRYMQWRIDPKRVEIFLYDASA